MQPQVIGDETSKDGDGKLSESRWKSDVGVCSGLQGGSKPVSTFPVKCMARLAGSRREKGAWSF